MAVAGSLSIATCADAAVTACMFCVYLSRIDTVPAGLKLLKRGRACLVVATIIAAMNSMKKKLHTGQQRSLDDHLGRNRIWMQLWHRVY